MLQGVSCIVRLPTHNLALRSRRRCEAVTTELHCCVNLDNAGDEMIDKAEPSVGRQLTERQFVVTDSMLADYYGGLRLTPREDGKVPTMLASDAENGYFGEIAFSNHIGHLWMRQGWECFGVLRRGETYAVRGCIRDIYPHRDRSVVYYEVEVRDAEGNLAIRTHHHQSFLREKPAGGQVTFRDPSRKPGARKFVLPEGERFGGLTRTITLEMCGEFFHGDANYHTDKRESEALGFHDVVVGGRMTLAYTAHLIEERFGDAWWDSGRLDLKFTNPAWPNDVITACGVDTGPADGENGRGRHGAFVWLEKADGTIVLIARASVGA